jgi:DNA polymerase
MDPNQTPPAPKKRGRKKIVDAPVTLLNTPGTKREQLQALYAQWFGCTRCDLCHFRDPEKPDIVFGEGNPDTADVVIVGEAPGEEEERTSVPFVGNSGQLLNQIIAHYTDDPGVREDYEKYAKAPRSGAAGAAHVKAFNEMMFEYRKKDFFITNAVGCRPPDNRQPNQIEIKACWERLWNIIYIIDPLLIIVAGNSALSAVLRKQQVQITRMRGTVFDATYDGRVGKVVYPVIPIYHPSYLLRKADWKVQGGDWQKTLADWKKAMNVLDFLRNKHYGTPIPQR